MYARLIGLAVILSILGGGAWLVHSWYSDSQELVNVKKTLADERAVAATLAERREAENAAKNRATRQLAIARRDADSLRVSLDGLSGSGEKLLLDAGTSQPACLERVATLRELLDTMAKAGGELAEKADRHVIDIQALRALGFKTSEAGGEKIP